MAEGPGDETYDKLEWYARLGVPEVWIVERDSRAVDIRQLSAQGYLSVQPALDGWLHSPVTGIAFNLASTGRLILRFEKDEKDLPPV
jgi:Uma2 family endonuclease